MKVTYEMIEKFHQAPIPHGWKGDELTKVRLQAVLDMIDPVPEGVDRIVDRMNRVWLRHAFDPLLWTMQGESLPVVRSIRALIETRGPIMWNGGA